MSKVFDSREALDNQHALDFKELIEKNDRDRDAMLAKRAEDLKPLHERYEAIRRENTRLGLRKSRLVRTAHSSAIVLRFAGLALVLKHESQSSEEIAAIERRLAALAVEKQKLEAEQKQLFELEPTEETLYKKLEADIEALRQKHKTEEQCFFKSQRRKQMSCFIPYVFESREALDMQHAKDLKTLIEINDNDLNEIMEKRKQAMKPFEDGKAAILRQKSALHIQAGRCKGNNAQVADIQKRLTALEFEYDTLQADELRLFKVEPTEKTIQWSFAWRVKDLYQRHEKEKAMFFSSQRQKSGF